MKTVVVGGIVAEIPVVAPTRRLLAWLYLRLALTEKKLLSNLQQQIQHKLA